MRIKNDHMMIVIQQYEDYHSKAWQGASKLRFIASRLVDNGPPRALGFDDILSSAVLAGQIIVSTLQVPVVYCLAQCIAMTPQKLSNLFF